MGEANPLLSVVITCFNYGDYVMEALESVLRQTQQKIEIIVVDGGSSDTRTLNTLNLISEKNVTVYFRDSPQLVGNNRNFGIARARAEYICCLDADDLLDHTYLEKALTLLCAGELDVISTSVQCFGDTEKVWRVAPKPTLELLLCKNEVATVAVFKKSLWVDVGGYRDYGIGKSHVAEDWDFWVRLAAHGARFHNIHDELLMKYRVHSSSLSHNVDNPSYAQQLIRIKKENAQAISDYFSRLPVC
jgi:O-antigen biosynthesis protein